MLARIPSPPSGTWHLGPVPIRAYAFAIMLGIVVAALIGGRRLATRTAGATAEDMLDVALWGVPFGIVGSRLWHVVTSPAHYFGPDGSPANILRIWEGGLGVWGAIAGGAVGALIACRRRGLRPAVVLDAVAPGLLVAQAIGRLGNYFNQELFGAPTTLPWGLEISAAHLPTGFPSGTLFHPTFLYELLWNLAMAAVLVVVDRRLRLGHGRVFALYVVLYCLGRGFIEMLRIDTAEHILGLRLNVWTSIILGLGALGYFVAVGQRHPVREADARAVGQHEPHA